MTILNPLMPWPVANEAPELTARTWHTRRARPDVRGAYTACAGL
jgi:hypothetical protein